MCGLVAILTYEQDLSSRNALMKEMLMRIAHRGPDGEGIHHVPNQALFGHRRWQLSIWNRAPNPCVPLKDGTPSFLTAKSITTLSWANNSKSKVSC